jgi:mannose-1-phosphate guanylyltransferase/mannose-6-phosphate isomerase
MVVTSADQTVIDTAAFTAAMQASIREAQAGTIIILGVTPDRPETGYGYIQTRPSSANSSSGLAELLQVQAFIEKPNQETAQQYINQGGYFWNAGMFVLKASVWFKALVQFRPNIAQAARIAWVNRTADSNTAGQFICPGKAEFATIPIESVDYAFMEHCPGSDFAIQMIPFDVGCSDLGAWDAVWSLQAKDAQGNAHQGDVLSAYTQNTLVHAASRQAARASQGQRLPGQRER